jgi:hypothetical protein
MTNNRVIIINNINNLDKLELKHLVNYYPD